MQKPHDKLKLQLQDLNVTLSAVASLCGRHVSTVSRQLAGHAILTSDVEEAAEQLIREARAARFMRVSRELAFLAGEALHRD